MVTFIAIKSAAKTQILPCLCVQRQHYGTTS